MNSISFVKRKDIDTARWSQLVQKSPVSLPYAQPWYLDAVAENWDGLVLNNYEAVMPLVWLRKLGVKCLYQPYFCQQLGVVAPYAPGKDLYSAFLAAAGRRFPFIHINLFSNAQVMGAGKNLKPKTNLLLPLQGTYLQLQKSFTENHRRNINRAIKAGMRFSADTGAGDFKTFYLQHTDREKQHFKTKHERIFKTLVDEALKHHSGHIFTALHAGGEIAAAVFIVQQGQRLAAVINVSSLAGKAAGASHFLFAEIIKTFAQSSHLLDFEGSSTPGIARFYEGFGAQKEVFYTYTAGLAKMLK